MDGDSATDQILIFYLFEWSQFIKFILVTFIGFFSHGVLADTATFDITSLGISDSSKTVYIGVAPDVPNTACVRKNQIRIGILGSGISDQVYATSLVAITTGRQISIDYDPALCLLDATKIGTISISTAIP